MKKILFTSAAVLFGMAVLIGVNDAQEKAKYTISEVMKMAMNAPKGEKMSLCQKVAGGTATADEKAKLIELFTALTQNTPKKGDPETWKTRAGALLAAAKADDGKALKAAANCGSCHDMYREKKNK